MSVNRKSPARWHAQAVAAVGGQQNVIEWFGSDDYQGAGGILATDERTLLWYYGSCSGCDSYEDAHTYEEGKESPVVELLRSEITTHDTDTEAREVYEHAKGSAW